MPLPQPIDQNSREERVLRVNHPFDEALSRTPWLSGSAFGIGDIPMGVYVYTYYSLAIERPSLPHVEDWYARLKMRPGYAEQVMIPLT